MQYRPKKYTSVKHLLLVGKGITFDSGGISIKPSSKMEEMKYDMAGGAAVAGIMSALEVLQPELKVTALIPAAENMPDAKALKPGDVVRSCNGKSIEIINTDAEGRLLLADVLAYGVKKYKPDWVIDLATLTGSVVVALGSHATGLFSNSDELAEAIKNAAERTGEKVWQMPLWDEYGKELESDVADLKNTGGREAGSISAAKFLEEFVDKTDWAHLDIAGTAYGQKHLPFSPKGASGVGVRLILEVISILSGCKA
jgi:leucyl aminopeptidase